MNRISKKITILIVLGILLTSTLIMFYSIPLKKKGLLIKLEFIYGKVPKDVYQNGAKLIIDIKAITPRGDLLSIYRDTIDNTDRLSFSLDPQQNRAFNNILKDWLERLSNESNQECFKTALIFDMWVIHKNGSAFRLEPPKAISYSPLIVSSEKVSLTLTIDDKKFVKVNETSSTLYLESSIKNEYNLKEKQFTIYYWETSYAISSYNLSSDGYVEVPVMILNNLDSDGATMQTSIDISFISTSKVIFYGVTSYGDKIYEKAKNGLPPQMINYMINKPILEHKVAFYENDQIHGGEKKYFYIIAKAIAYHQKEVKVTYIEGQEVSREYTGRERILQYIYDLKTYPSGRVYGGEKDGLPYFMDYLLQATYTRKIMIHHDPYLSDGDLDPQETVPLSLIYSNIGTLYQFPFSVGAPIGALMAYIANSVYPSLSFMTTPLLAGFISINIGNRYVGGGIKNSGSPNNSMELYVALSNYKYSFGGYLYDVPAGTYFIFKKVNSSKGSLSLFTYTENGYVKEKSLNIYSKYGLELTYTNEIKTTSIVARDRVLFKLFGYEKTILYIDCIKLYALLDNGSIIKLTLTKAYHNVFGDVTHFLVEDDDWRVVIAGKEHTSVGGHVIDLEFSIPTPENIVSFWLEIQGGSMFI